jgi:hypothetical protein
MELELIKKYIAMPMAIKVFQQDLHTFREFSIGNLYLDMVESIIVRLEKDFYKLKSELISEHHIDVRKLSNGKYKANNEVYDFTPEELKEMTSQVMSDYLYGDKAKKFERKERI